MPITLKTGAVKIKDASTESYVDIDMSLGVDYAPINSPIFAGTPQAPTPSLSDDSTKIATTEFIKDYAVPLTRTINGVALSSDITLSDIGAAPIAHASSAATYGEGTDSNYGHVKLTDSLVDSTTASTGGIALSAKAGFSLNSGITATQRAFAIVENSSTATRAYYVGDYVWVSNKLYRITANISNGGTITDGTNAERILEAERSIIYVTNTGVTCAERTYVDLASLTLRAGTWLLLGNHEFGSASEFAYQDVFRKGTSVYGITRNIPGAGGGGAVTMAIVTQDSGTGTFTYGTYGYGTAGTSRTANKIIVVAIRLY